MLKKIIKRSGEVEDFEPSKLNKWSRWASADLGDRVDWTSVVLHTVKAVGETIGSQELQKQLIKNCLQTKNWAYNLMAGKLYAALYRKELYNDELPTIKQQHENMVKLGYMVQLNYTDDEYKDIETFIDHDRDYKLAHFQIHQLRKKYSLNDKIKKKEFETPQFIFMRMAMALAEDEQTDKLLHVKNWYDHFSHGRINAPTPNYVNLGTKHNGYASCFPAGTLVDIFGGKKPIEEVTTGDHVIGISGNMRKVIGLTNRPYKGKLVSFASPIIFNHDIKATFDHKYFIKTKDGKKQWVKAKDIAIGDFLFHPLQKNNPEPICIWDIVKDDLIPLGYGLIEDKIGRINTYDNKGEFNKRINSVKNINIKNNENFYRLAGYFYSEGHATILPEKSSGHIGFTFNASDKYIIDDAFSLLTNLFEINVFERNEIEKDNCIRIICHSLILATLFRKLCGKGSVGKGDKLNFFATSNDKSLMHLIIGYIRGDGCAYKSGYVATSVSRELITLIRDAVLKLKYRASVSINKRPLTAGYGSNNVLYDLRINLNPSDDLAKGISKNLDKIKQKENCYFYTIFEDEGVYSKVKEFKIYDFDGIVYDFEVDQDHSFTVDGICVHNCCLYSTDDTAASLAIGDHIAYTMTYMSSGIGGYIGSRSLGNPVRDGIIEHQGKLPYYRSLAAAVKANLQGGRGGACTTYFSCYDPEANTIIMLQNPRTTKDKQNRDIHFAFMYNRLFAKKVAKNEDIFTFNKFTHPDLHELFFSDKQDEFEELYAKYETDPMFNKNYVSARQLVISAMQQSHEVATLYFLQIDEVNRHTSYLEPIYSSNLCVEVTQPTSPYHSMVDLYNDGDVNSGEVSLCSLAGIVVSNIKDDSTYESACYYALKMIDKCIHKSEYVLPHVGYTAKKRLNAGVGIIGLATALAKKNFKYDEDLGRKEIHRISERHAYYVIKASLQLGKELGNAPWIYKTKWSKGWLPIDTYKKNVDKIVSPEYKYDWETLRSEIVANQGIRNSSLIAHMPTESSSKASGAPNGVYPIRELSLKKTDLKNTIDWCAPDNDIYGDQYQVAWEISTEDMVKVYAIIQKFTDQSISADFYRDRSVKTELTTTELIKDFLDMVTYGVKSKYYQNSFTLDAVGLEDHLVNEKAECVGGCTL